MPHLVDGPIDVSAVLAAVRGPGRGGTSLFLGTVRRGSDDGPVLAIEYSAYHEMAEPEFARILAEAAERWPDAAIDVRHRTGRIPTGEVSIAVAVAAPHRAAAFAACRFVVDEVKQRVPIWKKELLEGGGSRWRANRESKESV